MIQGHISTRKCKKQNKIRVPIKLTPIFISTSSQEAALLHHMIFIHFRFLEMYQTNSMGQTIFVHFVTLCDVWRWNPAHCSTHARIKAFCYLKQLLCHFCYLYWSFLRFILWQNMKLCLTLRSGYVKHFQKWNNLQPTTKNSLLTSSKRWDISSDFVIECSWMV